MSRREVRIPRLAAVLLFAASGLAGCGSSEPEATESANKGAKPAGAHAARSVRQDMVAAVSSSKTPGPADLRFALAERPAVGQPLDLQLAITTNTEVDRLFGRFQAGEGLELVKGGESQHFEHPAAGTELTHTVTVIPKSDGIFYVTAVLLVDTPKDSIARSYSIPIIAGAGLPEAPPETPEPKPVSKP